MKTRASFAFVAVVIAIVSLAVFAQNSRKPNGRTKSAPSTTATTPDQVRHSKTVAYYFHGDVRCVTCRKLESLSHDVVTSEFAPQLKTGQLEWQVLNIDLPENAHFIKDYQLVTKSLVVVRYENGRQVEYKNLTDIWRLVNNEQAFRSYVKGEVQAALGKG